MKFFKFIFTGFAFCLSTVILQAQQVDTTNLRTLLVFFDGLRPDYITQEGMPNLYGFSKRAAYGKQHHSVFPTVTRVNASSYSTGSYPATNGLMGNTVYFPQVDKTKGLNTGEASEMMKVSVATDDHLLTAVSLGEVLQAAGKEMMVFSSGSSGQALMQNHKVRSIINTSMILPETLKQKVVEDMGPIPANGKPNSKQHVWITDALIRYGLRLDGPLVSAIWFSDPDGAAHSDGIGSPLAVQSIKAVDEQFGRILADLETKKLTDHFNIIVSTDHGFVTHIGKQGLAEFLIGTQLKQSKESEDVVVAEGAIYVQNHDAATIQKIVAALQAQEWVGAIFTKSKKAGELTGSVEGTLSFEAVHWNHQERVADILVDVNWNDDANSAGYKGASFARGVAGHGSLSPYEVHIALLAAGPSFKPAYQSALPSSNVDIVPTLLHIHHIKIPDSMEGRVLSELLAGELIQSSLQPRKEVLETSAKYKGGTYHFILNRTALGKYKYVDFSKVTRTVDN